MEIEELAAKTAAVGTEDFQGAENTHMIEKNISVSQGCLTGSSQCLFRCALRISNLLIMSFFCAQVRLPKMPGVCRRNIFTGKVSRTSDDAFVCSACLFLSYELSFARTDVLLQRFSSQQLSICSNHCGKPLPFLIFSSQQLSICSNHCGKPFLF